MLKKILKLIYPLAFSQFMRKCILKSSGYLVGKNVYLPASLKISDISYRRNNVIIHDRVSIGPGVLIITDSSPNHSRLAKIFPLVSKRVVIGQDTWVGANVTILPGITVGKCCVIGACSLVNKNIPDNSLAYGNPIRVINTLELNV